MPNIKSAEKRVKVIKTKTENNKAAKSKIATYVKKFKAAITAGDIAVAEESYKEVVSLLDKAARTNTIHANNASRKKARFAVMIEEAKKKA